MGTDERPRLLLLGAGVSAALAFLYAVGLFYIQFLLMVWGAAVIAGIAVYERRAGAGASRGIGLRDADSWVRLQNDLAAVEEKLSKSRSDAEKQYLRLRRASVVQDLRKLKWTMRESELENLRRATAPQLLRPIPTEPGRWQRFRREKREERHLLDSLGEAQEVVATDPPDAARERLMLIAADVRAHYRLMKGLGYESRNIRDYAAAWAALYSIAKGVEPEHPMRVGASRRVESKIGGLLALAASRSLAGRSTNQNDRGLEVEDK